MEIPIHVQNIPNNINDMMNNIQEQYRRCNEQVWANAPPFANAGAVPNMQFPFGGQYTDTNAFTGQNGGNWARAEAHAGTNGGDSHQSSFSTTGTTRTTNNGPEGAGASPRMEDSAETDNRATVTNDAEGFTVTLDVHNYKPNELSVKVVDKHVVVEGKCEEHQVEDGFVARHFVRKYIIPDHCDKDKVGSSLSTDGKLTVKIPAKRTAPPANERIIQIQQT